MAVGRDAQRYRASRHALRQLLASALDRLPETLVIETDEFGKPHFADGSSLHFNLSHSGHEGLIGVSPDRAIGVEHRGSPPGRGCGAAGTGPFHGR